jgi:hypothetical protein
MIIGMYLPTYYVLELPMAYLTIEPVEAVLYSGTRVVISESEETSPSLSLSESDSTPNPMSLEIGSAHVGTARFHFGCTHVISGALQMRAFV